MLNFYPSHIKPCPAHPTLNFAQPIPLWILPGLGAAGCTQTLQTGLLKPGSPEDMVILTLFNFFLSPLSLFRLSFRGHSDQHPERQETL